jgi:hypothetical protein
MKGNMKTLKAKIPVCKQEEAYSIIKMRFYSFSGTENGIYLRWNRKGEEIEDTAMREVKKKRE